MGTICNVVIVKLKNKKIILFSIILTLLLCTGGYELLKTFQYFSWKKSYQESGDWYQKLTVPSQNKKLMWEYRPNSKFREIETNQFGCREKKSVTLKKNSDTYRVAFVGDSLTLGLSVNAKDTFVKKYGDISNKDQKIKNDRAAADYVEYILGSVCLVETKNVLNYEGEEGFLKAFENIGELAMLTLMEDKKVMFAMERYTQYLDKKLIDKILKD